MACLFLKVSPDGSDLELLDLSCSRTRNRNRNWQARLALVFRDRRVLVAGADCAEVWESRQLKFRVFCLRNVCWHLPERMLLEPSGIATALRRLGPSQDAFWQAGSSWKQRATGSWTVAWDGPEIWLAHSARQVQPRDQLRDQLEFDAELDAELI
jgi:hypothetical protein